MPRLRSRSAFITHRSQSSFNRKSFGGVTGTSLSRVKRKRTRLTLHMTQADACDPSTSFSTLPHSRSVSGANTRVVLFRVSILDLTWFLLDVLSTFVWMILSVDGFLDLCLRLRTAVFFVRVVSSSVPVIFRLQSRTSPLKYSPSTGCVKTNFLRANSHLLGSASLSIQWPKATVPGLTEREFCELSLLEKPSRRFPKMHCKLFL